MKEQKFYCIKTITLKESPNDPLFIKGKWYNGILPNSQSNILYLDEVDTNSISIQITKNLVLTFTTVRNNKDVFLYDYFITPNMMRKLKLQKINSL